MLTRLRVFVATAVLLAALQSLHAQSFGPELNNTLMPASGAMGGVSIAAPQDVISAVHANPATLTQFQGSQFCFGGAWAEPTYNLRHSGGVLPGIGAFDAKSSAPGGMMGNIGMSQDVSALGMPVVLGLALTSDAGGNVNFNQVPASKGTSSSLLALGLTGGAGVVLTDKLSVGTSLTSGIGMFDGPFVGISSMTSAYAIRGSAGLTYQATANSSLGFYYQTKEAFDFENSILLALPGGGFSASQDIKMSLPENLGFGVSNNRLMDGNLLLAADILYKLWDGAELFDNIYKNQFVLQVGAQYKLQDWRLRAGYVYAENPLQYPPGISAGGVTPPGAVSALEYLQGQLAIINPHRISFGIGRKDLLPGLDADMFAGGMFKASEQLGPFTGVTVQSYYLGAGMTWRFGRGSSERLPVANQW